MSKLQTDENLLMSFLHREYSRDIDAVLMLHSVKLGLIWEEILKLEGYVH